MTAVVIGVKMGLGNEQSRAGGFRRDGGGLPGAPHSSGLALSLLTSPAWLGADKRLAKPIGPHCAVEREAESPCQRSDRCRIALPAKAIAASSRR